jgi:ABC-2 type transport system ATP-binding protein
MVNQLAEGFAMSMSAPTSEVAPSGTAPGIDVRHVARSFGDVHAVRDVTFTVPPGSVTALVGPNGSGKTTLMLMLASLLKPDAGEVRIAGFDPVAAPAEVRARLGWMPDVLGSWASLSVRRTLEITGRLYRFDRERSGQRAAELIELVGLGELADAPTRVLSRGQKQRLSLARALVHDPQVLVLDEPASGLDPTARVALRSLVRQLAAAGKSILISSHVLAELEEMADAAVFLERGATASDESVARARESRRDWRIRTLDDASLRTALAASGLALEDIRTDHAGTLVSVRDEPAAAQLLAELVRAGVPVTAFAPAVGNLEHTLLDLVKERGE